MKGERPNSDSFFRFCKTVQQIAETRGSNRKTATFAEYLRSLEEESVALATRFIGEGAFSSVSGKRVSVGHRTIAVCAAEFCEIDYDLVFKSCRTATGSASETIEKLMENLDVSIEKRTPAFWSLSEIQARYELMQKTGKRDKKQRLLTETWQHMTPIEIKYFIRVMGQGSLRIGFESKSIVNAMALAWNQNQEDVRYAHMLTGSLEKTALLCRTHSLEQARFRLFQPLSFMLASPIQSRTVEDVTQYIAEEKFDGMRCQVHVEGSKTVLFSRDMNDITASFPEIADAFIKKNMPAQVLDGEICVFNHDIIQPFQLLQKRMGVKKPTENLLKTYPVIFIAYDILCANGAPVFDLTLTDRRKILEDTCQLYEIRYSRQFELTETADIDRFFDRALAHGNEGLMLKMKSSTYEYGQRRKSWLKVKKPGGSVDTIIMYAHAGSGKRGGTYSDFTLGISVKEDSRYEEEFIPIGKAYGGYTDDELKKLNKALKPLIVERFGPTLSIKPGIVVEIEFDDIQLNKRTKAGYTLRFPRFRAIRWDLSPSDADTLTDIENLYQQKLTQSRKPQQKHASFE